MEHKEKHFQKLSVEKIIFFGGGGNCDNLLNKFY